MRFQKETEHFFENDMDKIRDLLDSITQELENRAFRFPIVIRIEMQTNGLKIKLVAEVAGMEIL